MENKKIMLIIMGERIYTSIDEKLTRYKGDFSGKDSNEEYLKWLSQFLIAEDIKLLILGNNKSKIEELYSLLKSKKNNFIEDDESTLEKIEEVLLKYVKIKEKTILKIIEDGDEKIYLKKEQEKFFREKISEKFDEEIFILNNKNKDFFKVKSQSSKNIKAKKENLKADEEKKGIKGIFKKFEKD